MKEEKKYTISRRDTIKALATIPVAGLFANRFYVKYKKDLSDMKLKIPELDVLNYTRDIIPSATYPVTGEKIRIGLVGNGWRGPGILKALGFASEEYAKDQSTNGKISRNFRKFLDQKDLNIEITGVCDTFSLRAEEASAIVTSTVRSGGAKKAQAPKIYKTYRDMLEDNNLDAIVINTPDHWHAKMAIDAANAGKHVYLEKPMCQTAEEARELRDVVKKNGVIFQVGHQNRQQASFIKAREVIEKNILGNISLIETFTNRNNDHGAWIRTIDPRADLSNINWKEFLGHKPWREPDLDRYFNWQKWFEYGTGPAGNQFTHHYDSVNQIMDLGIPERVMAAGGNYYFKDPRDIPDVFNVIFEYPEKKLTLKYDCSLLNSRLRNKTFLGSHGTMIASSGLTIYADEQSDKYKDYKLDFNEPVFVYDPREDIVDGVTSATAKFYHDSGFGDTYNNGIPLDSTYLHMKEWIYCIRKGIQPSCNVDRGFEETTTFYMANLSYLEKRTVRWDPVNERII